ncbi:hypothetical protein [Aureimonas jatrophae]|jgi:hypothetical protein|uniref:Uncharacterized protein n=1 Tax=Aureimonas jatrophae TaxID=1166073 RepID=A0A1H0BYK0_9HYPH|nr:hypothetical protein [Aureimonas jatrophae]MBB3948990.1 hypothetical protein [Aureimonas jatrophae]SDN50714.1 hypothetical protein SAMN05192530_10160 [Aureimonas jatrophae]
MSEQKGFFRRIFSFGAKEEERVSPESELPRVNDTTAKRDGALDPEIHQPAAAATNADAEAGADASEPVTGGITPLTPRPPSADTEKKTLN